MSNQHPIVFITPNPIMLYPCQKASHSVTYTIRSYCFYIYIPNLSFYTLIKELHIVLHMRLASYCLYIYIYSIPSFYIPIKELYIVLRMLLASYCFFIYIYLYLILSSYTPIMGFIAYIFVPFVNFICLYRGSI